MFQLTSECCILAIKTDHHPTFVLAQCSHQQFLNLMDSFIYGVDIVHDDNLIISSLTSWSLNRLFTFAQISYKFKYFCGKHLSIVGPRLPRAVQSHSFA